MIDATDTLTLSSIPLMGTDKQRAWGYKIIASFQSLANGTEDATLPTITSSPWWIEHRDDSLDALREAAYNYKEIFESPFTTRYPVKHKDYAISTLQALSTKNLIICDTETTGLGKGHEIISIAMVTLSGETIVTSFIRPARATITKTAYAIHGIAHQMLEKCPTFDLIWPVIASVLEDGILLSYNGSFDASMIRRSLDACDMVAPHISCTCIMKLTQAYLELEDPLRLQEACDRLGIDASGYGKAHGALADALTASHVLRELIGRSAEE